MCYKLSVLALIYLHIVSCNIWAQHRGLATLPLLDPRYPIWDIYDVLKESSAPTLNILYGTFGKSKKNLDTLLGKLVNYHPDFRDSIRIGVYVTCGPCRRPRRDGTLEHFRPRLTISQLNGVIERRNRVIITNYRKRVKRIFSFSNEWLAYPIEWRIFPELEDNLTWQARAILINVLNDEIRQHPEWHIAINPLKPIVTQLPLEVHSDDINIAKMLQKGDAISLDGIDRFPTQALVDISTSRKIDLLYWDRAMQDPNKPISQRKYHIQNKPRLKSFMRGRVTL